MFTSRLEEEEVRFLCPPWINSFPNSQGLTDWHFRFSTPHLRVIWPSMRGGPVIWPSTGSRSAFYRKLLWPGSWTSLKDYVLEAWSPRWYSREILWSLKARGPGDWKAPASSSVFLHHEVNTFVHHTCWSRHVTSLQAQSHGTTYSWSELSELWAQIHLPLL